MTVANLISLLSGFPQDSQVVIEAGGEAVSALLARPSAWRNEYGVVIIDGAWTFEVEADGKPRLSGSVRERQEKVKARNAPNHQT